MSFYRSIDKFISICKHNYAIIADTISYRNKKVNHIDYFTDNIPIYISTRLVKWYTKIDNSIPVGIAIYNKQGNPVILINEACEHYVHKATLLRHELGHIKRGHFGSFKNLPKEEREFQADVYAANTIGVNKVLSWLSDYKVKLSDYPETRKLIEGRIRRLITCYGVEFLQKKE